MATCVIDIPVCLFITRLYNISQGIITLKQIGEAIPLLAKARSTLAGEFMDKNVIVLLIQRSRFLCYNVANQRR